MEQNLCVKIDQSGIHCIDRAGGEVGAGLFLKPSDKSFSIPSAGAAFRAFCRAIGVDHIY